MAAASVLIVYFLRNTSNTRVEYCGPNHTDPVTIFTNPDQAFPSFASAYQVKLNAGVNLLDTLSKATGDINAGTEIQTEIVELREKLNQDNIRMENLMRSSFYAYNSRPCNPEVSKRYLDMLDTLTQKITEIEKFKASIAKPENGPTKPKDSVLTSDQVSKDTANLKKAIFQYRRNLSVLRVTNPRIREP